MSSIEEGRGEASNRIESDPDSAEDASPQPQRSAIIEPDQSVGEVRTFNNYKIAGNPFGNLYVSTDRKMQR